MKMNIGNTDRLIRVAIAALLAILYFTNTVTGIWGILALVVGGVLLLTSLVGFCPLYRILGVRTRYQK